MRETQTDPISGGLIGVIGQLLGVRHPGKVVLDGIMVMGFSSILQFAIYLWIGPNWGAGEPSTPHTAMALSYFQAWVWWAGVLIASTGVARLLGTAVGEGLARRGGG